VSGRSAALPRDCDDVYSLDNRASSGVYNIYPDENDTAVEVFCDMDTDGGKWTVFQRRMDGTVLFYRPWEHYKKGFGRADGEHWLGLEKLHYLSSQKRYELRVDMEEFSEQQESRAFALYTLFHVDSEEHGYTLHVDGFRDGGAGDSLSVHNGKKFSTLDRDQDGSGYHCARKYLGGFWYSNCFSSNPNGLYLWGDDHTHFAIGVTWYTWKDYDSLKSISMKIRPFVPREEQNDITTTIP